MNAIVPGTTRYARSLGFVGATAAESSRNWIEKATGLDFTGKFIDPTNPKDDSSGITVGAAPSTIIAMITGALINVSMGDYGGLGDKKSSPFARGFIGAAIGAGASVLLRFATKTGW